MGSDLKAGDRVRVTGKRPVYGYQPGSRGVVQSGPTTGKDGRTYYTVSMDKDAAGDATLFLADEIQADAPA
jgi:hypothetical protein